MSTLLHLLKFLIPANQVIYYTSEILNIQSILAFACIDTDSDCADKAANGECDSDPDNMLKSCTASCNVGQCECRNLNDNCPYWASVGECSNSASYMKTNCKSSCGYCGANTCEDSDPQACEDWAAVGECTADPVYMNQWCAKACQRCGE